MAKAKAVQVTISGSYYDSTKEIQSFSSVVGYTPDLSDDKVTQMAIRRYAKMWIGQTKADDGSDVYSRVARVREVFIDATKDVEGDFSYIGKDIMQMTAEELQDLAAAKDLAGVPLYKVGSLALARRIAFSEYAVKVLGMDKEDMDHRQEGFNPADHDTIKADAKIRMQRSKAMTSEESIDREQLVLNKELKASDDTPLSLEQLQTIAKQKGINSKGLGSDALYKRLYGDVSAAA